MNTLVFFLLCLLYISEGSNTYERDLTVNVDPGKSDCFYQHADEKQTIDIEFQVIDGTRGSLDVGFLLSAPGGRILAALGRRQSGVARAIAPVTGDYKFCFDNTHSTISSKTVYFDLLVDNDDDDDSEEETNDNEEIDQAAEEMSKAMIEVIERVSSDLTKVRRLQEGSAARSSRDNHAASRSLSRVTVYSASNALAVLTIGILQVILLRSLFDEKSKVRAIWNKLPFKPES